MDPMAKEILLFNFKQSIDSVKDLVAYQNKVLRHEIIHAFLYESGLWQDSYGSKCWAQNEEMVDWFAIQEPKIHKAFKEAGCDVFISDKSNNHYILSDSGYMPMENSGIL